MSCMTQLVSRPHLRGAACLYKGPGMIIPSLKCVAWNARIVVVGFAAGSIEKVCEQ